MNAWEETPDTFTDPSAAETKVQIAALLFDLCLCFRLSAADQTQRTRPEIKASDPVMTAGMVEMQLFSLICLSSFLYQ